MIVVNPSRYCGFQFVIKSENNYFMVCENSKELSVLDSKNLVKLLKNGDIHAFDVLYKQFADRLFGFAFSMLKDRLEAKEIVQETFYRIWENREALDVDKSFKSFIFKISYNIIIDQFRRRSKEEEYKDYLKLYFQDKFVDLESEIYFNELTEQLDKIVGEMPDRRKEIYVLSRKKGLSHKEIAKKLNISIKTVENQIGISQRYIKKQLQPYCLSVTLFIYLVL